MELLQLPDLTSATLATGFPSLISTVGEITIFYY